VRKDSVGTGPRKIFPLKIFGYGAFYQRIHFFANFGVTAEKMLRARVRSILMPPTSHIASLNRHTPKFSGVPQKLTWCWPFSVQGLPKSGNNQNHQNSRFWGVFCTKSIFLAKRPIFPFSMSHIFWKLFGLRVNLIYLGTIYVNPVTRQIFRISWNLVLLYSLNIKCFLLAPKVLLDYLRPSHPTHPTHPSNL